MFTAIYTEADGLHTTTVKNALSDLYNKSTSENIRIEGRQLFVFFLQLLEMSLIYFRSEEANIRYRSETTWW